MILRDHNQMLVKFSGHYLQLNGLIGKLQVPIYQDTKTNEALFQANDVIYKMMQIPFRLSEYNKESDKIIRRYQKNDKMLKVISLSKQGKYMPHPVFFTKNGLYKYIFRGRSQYNKVQQKITQQINDVEIGIHKMTTGDISKEIEILKKSRKGTKTIKEYASITEKIDNLQQILISKLQQNQIKGVIYGIYEKKSGKLIYIGQTRQHKEGMTPEQARFENHTQAIVSILSKTEPKIYTYGALDSE